MRYETFRSEIPEGRSGNWAVERFEVTKRDEEFERLRAITSPRMLGRWVRAGKYTKLTHKGRIVMSDTHDEYRDHAYAIKEAWRRGGHVLVNGLGLGCVLRSILAGPLVTQVTVVEISPDVLSLVRPFFVKVYGDIVEFVEDDALAWKPPRGVRYSVVWHDIWSDICADNHDTMKTLHRRFGRRADWQGSWGRPQTRRLMTC